MPRRRPVRDRHAAGPATGPYRPHRQRRGPVWPAALLAIALAFARIAGRTTDEWALTAASYASERQCGRTRYLADRPPD